MTTKLTLTVDKETIEKAKKYAKDQGRSLSSIVENYLKLLSSKDREAIESSDSKIIKSLKGSLKLPDDFDYEEARMERLEKKYLSD